jgi:ribonuclease HII
MAPIRPTWRAERALWRDGFERVAGVDEVGRGPLAGPVVAAAVVLPFSRAKWVSRLRDSKLLSAAVREELAAEVRERCEWGIGTVSQQAIDQIGIAPATRLAMRRAVLALPSLPDALIVDGREHVDCAVEQRSMVKADAHCKSVAAASIVAKVARDAEMVRLAERFTGYGFERNKGYGSAEHLDALRTLGYSTVHRLSFQPVRAAIAR